MDKRTFVSIVDDLEAKTAAFEVLLLSLLKTIDINDIKAAYTAEKERALTALLHNETVSDTLHTAFETALSHYEDELGL